MRVGGLDGGLRVERVGASRDKGKTAAEVAAAITDGELKPPSDEDYEKTIKGCLKKRKQRS